jgi:hypothetical protein
VTWKQKPCGCVNTRLLIAGKVTIRCEQHRGKPAKKGRLLCHFEDGLVRRG